MTHPIELATAELIQTLRYDQRPVYSASELKLTDKAYFSWDSDRGDVTLSIRPELGCLFRANASVRRKPGWFSFNLSLDAGAFEPGSVLGLVVEMQGCSGQKLPVFLRARQDGALRDVEFADSLQGTEARGVQTLLHRVGSDDLLSRPCEFLTLVMRLPVSDFSLDLFNLTLFVLPSAALRRLDASAADSMAAE